MPPLSGITGNLTRAGFYSRTDKKGWAGNMEKQYVIDDFKLEESWRLFKIMGEFVDGVEALHNIGPAVTLFGSARINPEDPIYKKAVEIAALFVKEGFAVISGGGPGIMEAANKGAKEAGGTSVGLNIELPFEQIPNPYADIQVNFRYFFVRKVMLVKYAMAYIIMPGGFGTLDELFEAVTLIQTERIKPFPVILVGADYWQGLIDWIKDRMLAEKRISPEDVDILQIIDDPGDVVKAVTSKVII